MPTKKAADDQLNLPPRGRYSPEGGQAITVPPLDEEFVPDAPKKECVEVVVLVDSLTQRLNSRTQYTTLEEKGVRLPDKFKERERGDRILVDAQELPRLLAGDVVIKPEDIEAEGDLDAKAAELEAQRVELEGERLKRREEAREEAMRIAEEAAAGKRSNLEGPMVPAS